MKTSLIPAGTKFNRLGVRITFVEFVDDYVLRFVLADTDEEYFYETSNGRSVRFTLKSFLDEYADGRVRDLSASEASLSEWGGRYLGLDRAACLAKQPWAVFKYDVALAAITKGLPRSAEILTEFAKIFQSGLKPPPSGRSVIRWMNNLEAHDEKIGAMVNRSGRERGRSQLPPVSDRIVQQAMALYYTKAGLQKMDCHALAVGAWTRLSAQGVEGLGEAPPSKTAVINRINKNENQATWASKYSPHEATRYFHASGETLAVRRPFDLVWVDGTEFDQITLFASDVPVPSNKMKSVQFMDSCSLFAFPSNPFAGPYRAEMGMNALLSVLTPPVLADEVREANPLHVLFFGKIGRLRGDNDRAIIPPSAIGNLASLVSRVELAKRYGSDEKANLENYFGWLKTRLADQPGTVLSPRSRKRSIRRDPLAEATMTRASFARKLEALRLEWNDQGHDALGGRSPNDIMLEHILEHGTRYIDGAEVRRHLSRTVPAVLTTDGVEYDGIRYGWNRAGVTSMLSANLQLQPIRKRLEGTAKLDVFLRVFDWNLDMVEVMDEADNSFLPLWSDDPDYTEFLTRYEHSFYQKGARTGQTGAKTSVDRALRRAQQIQDAWADVNNAPYALAKQAAAVLECAEVRERARSVAGDPDLMDLSAFLIPTDVCGTDRADVPRGPSQSRKGRKKETADSADPTLDPRSNPNWGGLDPAPRSNLDALVQLEEDPDQGINWDDEAGATEAGEEQ